MCEEPPDEERVGLRGCIPRSPHPQGLSSLQGEGSVLRPSGERGEEGRAAAHTERGYSMPANFTYQARNTGGKK